MPLRIAVLSRGPHLHATRRLVAAGRERGHWVDVVDFTRVNVTTGGGKVAGTLDGKSVERYDLAIGRISPLYTPLGGNVLRAWEMSGVRCSPSAAAIGLVRDKFLQALRLTEAGIPTPATAMVNDLSRFGATAAELGAYPLVVKPLHGTHGSGVVLVHDAAEARRELHRRAERHEGVVVQEYIAETGGADVRALVSAHEVVAAVSRRATPGDFRSNFHLGGSASPTDLSPAERNIALAATRALGLDVAGVDLLRSDRGPLVLEVNASPGFEGIERVTGVDIAGAIIDTLTDARTLLSGS